MINKKVNLIVAAHPDDETIFFSGLIQQKREFDWLLICVTDGNADGKQKIRVKKLQKACQILKIKYLEHWNFPDIYEKRLDTNSLIKRLKKIKNINQVFTHGILGEYGHPHHQDISYAVQKAFYKKYKVFSITNNFYPSIKIILTKKQYLTKIKILNEVYKEEFDSMAHLLPASLVEGYSKHSLDEIEMIYQYLAKNKKFDNKKFKDFFHLKDHIKITFTKIPKRKF